MQDSNITYTVTAKGIEEAERKFARLGGAIKNVAINQDGTVTATGKLTAAQAAQAQAVNRASSAQKSYFGHIARTTIQSALINKLFLEFVDVSGQAVKQVDLMNNFPATMASMGQSTKDASDAFQGLRNYVGQVGGNLGDAASMVTRFTGVTKDVKSSVAIFTALNNALIAGDSSMEEQRLAAIQFAQAFERGKPDMREWLALTQNMSQQLGMVAKEMGYVNATALGEALRTGEESMSNFTVALAKLSTGTGPIAEQAYARMNGMQFAFNVMKNTMVQGLAAIINAFGRANIVSFFTFLTQVIQVLTGWVITLINWLGNLANIISRLFGGGNIWKGITGEATKAGSAIQGGAGAADDLGKGLDGAKKKAKELNKSLAGFDKMNVLPDKESGGGGSDSGGSGGGGGGAFDPGQIADMKGIFDGLTGGMKEASKWAKIFAGIIAGIAALKLGLGIMSGLNNAVDTIKNFKTNMDLLKKSMKTMADDMKKAGKDIGDAFKNAAKGQTPNKTGKEFGGKFGTSILTGLAASLGSFASKIWPLLMPILAPIGAAIGGVVTAIGTFLAGLGAVTIGIIIAIVVAVIAAIYLIWKNWDTIWSWIKDISDKTWQGIQKGWDAVTQFFVKLWHGIYNGATTAWNAITAGLQAVWDFIQPIVNFIVNLFIIVLGGAFLLVVAAAQSLWKGIQTYFNFVWGIATWLGSAFTTVFTKIWETIKNVAGWIGDKLTTVFTTVRDFIAGVLDAIWTKVSEIWNKIWEFISPFLNKIVDFFKERWDTLKANITLVFNTIFDFIKNIWDKIYGAISGVVKKITDFFAPAAKWLFDKGKAIVQGLIDGIKNMFNAVWNGVKYVADQIGKFFSGAWNWLFDAGKSIIQGLINGIKNMFGSVDRVVQETADKIKNKIKSIFGIHSPSRLMAEYGANIGQGLANGIEDSSRAIERSLNGIQNMALDTVQVTASTVMPDMDSSVDVDNGSDWVQKIAGEISIIANDKSQPVALTVQIGEERIANQIIELINEKTQMSGRNAILV